MPIYECELCNYKTKIKSQLQRHLNTKKHATAVATQNNLWYGSDEVQKKELKKNSNADFIPKKEPKKNRKRKRKRTEKEKEKEKEKKRTRTNNNDKTAN